MIQKLRNVENNDLEDTVFRKELTDNEIENIIDRKYNDASTK